MVIDYKLNEIGLENLRNAIVVRAIKDLEEEKYKYDALKFLKSDYFRELTNLNPNYIFKKLKEYGIYEDY